MIQSPGRFGRLDAHVFHELVLSDRALREAAQRYAGAMLALRGQWVACNARHTIEQRLARWLLATRDRVGDEIHITQDIVAMMLGVRRASVVTALGRFVDEGLVNHGYARVRVVDDVRLEHLSCPCYGRAAALRREAYAG
jgi:CRP-like cAMP-binding protein